MTYVISSLPGDVTIGQGQTLRVDLTASIHKSEHEEGRGREVISASSSASELDVAIDNGALTLHAGYEAPSPKYLTLSTPDGSSYEIAVIVRPLRWLERVLAGLDGPEEREHAAVFLDEARRRLLMVGGSGYQPYGTPLADAWAFDLDTHAWAPAAQMGDVPPPGASRRVAAVPGTTTAYLFGGYGEQGRPNGDLYRVDFAGDGLDFRRVPQENPPGWRSLHAFAYDPGTDRFALFGGVAMRPLGDTWTMRLVNGVAVWQEQDPWPAPSPRYGAFTGFDAANGRLVLFSGAQGTRSIDPAHDTWALDLRAEAPAWSRLCAGQPAPAGRRNGCAVFDPDGPRLFVFGGTDDGQTTQPGLFVLDARPGREEWAVLELEGEPALRSSGFGVYDPRTQRTLMGFGNTTRHIFNDWAFLGY